MKQRSTWTSIFYRGEMVKIGCHVSIAKCVFVVTLIGQGVRASIEDVLAGLSTPELNSLLEDLDSYQDGGGAEYGGGGFSPHNLGMDEEDYGGATDYIDVNPDNMMMQTADVKRSADQGAPPAAAASKAATAAMLPAYCDPPNPCPPGYSSADGCIEDFENSSDFSRNFQSQQKCICDTEHMFNCPAGQGAQPSQPPKNHKTTDTSFLSEMPGLTADGRENPYFGGQKLPIAAKKGMDF